MVRMFEQILRRCLLGVRRLARLTTGNITTGTPGGTGWRRAEFVLTGAAVLCFLLIPIHLTTIYGGLPAHPLFLHVPVMLIPLTAIGAIACVARPEWFRRYGIALSILAIVAMASLFLTMGAGSALRDALHLGGGFGDSALIARHSAAADKLRILDILFTAVIIVAFAAHRISGGMPTGIGLIDRILRPNWAVQTLGVLIVVLALGSGYMTWKTGDLGAKAVWGGRLHQGGGFPGGGGPPSFR